MYEKKECDARCMSPQRELGKRRRSKVNIHQIPHKPCACHPYVSQATLSELAEKQRESERARERVCGQSDRSSLQARRAEHEVRSPGRTMMETDQLSEDQSDHLEFTSLKMSSLTCVLWLHRVGSSSSQTVDLSQSTTNVKRRVTSDSQVEGGGVAFLHHRWRNFLDVLQQRQEEDQ